MSAQKRIAKELKDIRTDPETSSIFVVEAGTDPVGGDGNAFQWSVAFAGAENSIFHGRVIRLILEFPKDYPFKPFKIIMKHNPKMASAKPTPPAAADRSSAVRYYARSQPTAPDCDAGTCCWNRHENWTPALTVSKVLRKFAHGSTARDGDAKHVWTDNNKNPFLCMCEVPPNISDTSFVGAKRWFDRHWPSGHDETYDVSYTHLDAAVQNNWRKVVSDSLSATSTLSIPELIEIVISYARLFSGIDHIGFLQPKTKNS